MEIAFAKKLQDLKIGCDDGVVVHPRLIDDLGIPYADVRRDDDVVPRIRGCGRSVCHDRAEGAECAAVCADHTCVVKALPVDAVHVFGVGSNAVAVMACFAVDQVFGIEVADQNAVFLLFGKGNQRVELFCAFFLAAPVQMQRDDRDLLAADGDPAC